MPAIQFPRSPFHPEDLADWLELVAIQADDQNASAGDLDAELRRLGCGNREDILGRVFKEIDLREKGAGEKAYPFARNRMAVQLKAEAKDFPAYIFCLALSYCQWNCRAEAPENPWLLFEELARFSAKNYLGGEAIVFGTSARDEANGGARFVENVNKLVKCLGEGEGFRDQPLLSVKDSKLDLVAWKGFADGRPSQIILFGQCAGGGNWVGKLSELIPQDFWDQWMKTGKVSWLLRSFFMPHRIFEIAEWEQRARRARLLFDRCRVVAHAHEETATGAFADRLLNCCRNEWQIRV